MEFTLLTCQKELKAAKLVEMLVNGLWLGTLGNCVGLYSIESQIYGSMCKLRAFPSDEG